MKAIWMKIVLEKLKSCTMCNIDQPILCKFAIVQVDIQLYADDDVQYRYNTWWTMLYLLNELS